MKKKFFVLLLLSWMMSNQSQTLKPIDVRNTFLPPEFYLPDTSRTYTSFQPIDPEDLVFSQEKHRIKTSSKLLYWLLNKEFFLRKRKDYILRIQPLLILEAGKTNDSNQNTFRNTRGIKIDAAIGKQVVFSSSILENQAKFPAFYERLFGTLKPGNNFPGTIPGEGIAKIKKNGAYDFPVAEGFVRYQPSDHFIFELGHGRSFIGDGFRSLFLSGETGPIPYFRLDTKFWHVRYTVMWSMLQDIRSHIMSNGFYYKKYMATHFLDWAVTPKWHLGVFENVIWDPVIAGRGFDLNFLNPFIFFKTIEFQSGTKTANTVLGLQSSYKFFQKTHIYGQFLLDEMTVRKFFGDPGYWGNKYGFQIGIKTAQQIGSHKIFGRLEWNQVRPYTYSHHLTTINYGHNNWPLAHPFGANFKEFVAEFHWYYKRFFLKSWMNFSQQGHEIPGDNTFYGANIYRDYEDRTSNTGIKLLQGNLIQRNILDMEAGWTVNSKWPLQIYAGIRWRKQSVEIPDNLYKDENLTWLKLGIRTFWLKNLRY